jgi:glycosyltransferase 2 family protein
MKERLQNIRVFFRTHAWLRVVLQVGLALGLLLLMIRMVQGGRLLEELQTIPLWAFVLGLTIQLVGFPISILRWHLLLRYTGVHEPYPRLVQLYFIGLFCSLFLPTGTGGDVVRVIEVARTSRKPAETALATLQERFFGLGVSMLIGLSATLYYLPIMPPDLRSWALILQIGGAAIVAFLIYPQLLFAMVGWVWQRLRHRQFAHQFANHPWIQQMLKVMKPITQLPPLPIQLLGLLLLVSSCAALFGIVPYYIVGQALDPSISFPMVCLVVPLVWVIRMAPISLGGIGVSEGSFTFLIGLFGIASATGLALALAGLAIQTSCALLGGALLLSRILRGTWQGFSKTQTQQELL